jgi:hypothetical protein
MNTTFSFLALIFFLISLTVIVSSLVLIFYSPSFAKEGLPHAVSGLSTSTSSSPSIPKFILQVSREYQPPQIVEALMKHAPGYCYINLIDDGCIDYFRRHPMKEFPALEEKFNSFRKGAHKADLFRYVFLYQQGGVFIDSDMMLYENLNLVLGNHDLVTIRGYEFWRRSLFNGFIGTVQGHPILLEALRHAYTTCPEELDRDYFLFVKKFHEIIQRHCLLYPDSLVGIYQERLVLQWKNMHTVTMSMFPPRNHPQKVIARHFFWNKKIDLSI